ncbi:MAG TPA: hypothetical protein VN213_00670 [Solirubrobacteraceae bacterium]|nr:hypothetical protein [Solirubrobacteraceae bacterium]
MAQTKRKRRSKHRGTAAGTVEARGRTGRKPTSEERKKADAAARRDDRLYREPTWRGAAVRAGFAAVMLFVLFQIGIGPRQDVASTAALSLLAFGIYVPLGYITDRAIWKRRMRKAGRPLPAKRS